MVIALYIVGGLLLLAVLVWLFKPGPAPPLPAFAGDLNDVERIVTAMCTYDDRPDEIFLIIDVVGTSDFVQMLPFDDLVEVDLPIATARQESLETTFRKFAENRGYPLLERPISLGKYFLDVHVPSKEAPLFVKELLLQLFSLRPDAPLQFHYTGFLIPQR